MIKKFVIEQIAKLTGRPYLGGYGSDMEQFAALMEAGAVAAEELNLEIGVALTAEQMASLTSDIVMIKSGLFTVVSSWAERKMPKGIVIFTEAGIITAVNTELNNANIEWGD